MTEPPPSELADEATRGQTTRAPMLALGGVTVAVAAIVIVILAIALILYYVV